MGLTYQSGLISLSHYCELGRRRGEPALAPGYGSGRQGYGLV